MNDSLVFIFGFFVFVVAGAGLLFSCIEIRKMYPPKDSSDR